MEGFFGTILIIVLIFWLLGFVFRFALRQWVTRKQRQMGDQFGGEGGYQTFGRGNFRGFYSTSGTGQNQQQQKPKQKEGEVTIEVKEPQKNVSKSIGEYVEFEEVDQQ